MIDVEKFVAELIRNDVDAFFGVPDSLLMHLCAHLAEANFAKSHVLAANEGNAVAMAVGYHLATKRIGAVYLQNSGLGNAINPLVSVADSEVYQIPMLLLVGWRGEEGVKDEPQHIKQGKISSAQLELLGIPSFVLDNTSDTQVSIAKAIAKIRESNSAVALLVRKDTFADYPAQQKAKILDFTREDAIRTLLHLLDDESLVIATTGKTSRELYELRVERNEPPRDFLCVGGMGHTSSIALGVSFGAPEKKVVCLDGDGSLLMHMGALPIIGDIAPANFLHVLINNCAHESVGGQPTVAGQMDFEAIAYSCGYAGFRQVDSVKSLQASWGKVCSSKGPFLLEIKVDAGSRSDLGRPRSTPIQNKMAFMDAIGNQ